MLHNNLIWLDEAFSKQGIDVLEAACCLVGCSKEGIRVNRVHLIYLHSSDIYHPEVSRVYEIIKTWVRPTRVKPLLWFIDRALVRNTPYVQLELLFSKCREDGYRQKEIINNYPELAKKLGLNDESSAENENNQNEKSLEKEEIAWRVNARKIYYILGLDKIPMTLERKAKKVEEEMKRRHAADEKGMTKRGGKQVPDFESIRRLVLSKF